MDPADSRREENTEHPEKSLEQSLLTRLDGIFSTSGLQRYPERSYTSDSEALSTKDTKAIIQRVSNRIDKPVVWEPSIGSLSPEMVFRFSKDVLDRYPSMAGKYLVETPETEEGAGDELPLAQSTGTAPNLPRRRKGSSGIEPEMPTAIPAAARASAEVEREQPKPERVIHAPAAVQRKPGVRPVSRIEEVNPASSTRESAESIDIPGLPPESSLLTAEQNFEKIARKAVPEIQHEEQPRKEVVQRKPDSSLPKAQEIPLEAIPSDRPKNIKIDNSQIQTFEPRRPRPAPQRPLVPVETSVVSKPVQRKESGTGLSEHSTHAVNMEKEAPSHAEPVREIRRETIQKIDEEKKLPSVGSPTALPDMQREIEETVHGKELNTDTIPSPISSVQSETDGITDLERGDSDSSQPSVPVVQREVEGLSQRKGTPLPLAVKRTINKEQLLERKPLDTESVGHTVDDQTPGSGKTAQLPIVAQPDPPAAYPSDIKHDVDRTIQREELDTELPQSAPENKGTTPQMIQRESKPTERKTQVHSVSDLPLVPVANDSDKGIQVKTQRRGEEISHEPVHLSETDIPVMEESPGIQVEPSVQGEEAAESSQLETPKVRPDLPANIHQPTQAEQQDQILQSKNEYPELTLRPTGEQGGEDAPASPQPEAGLESLARSIHRKFDMDFSGKDQGSVPSSNRTEITPPGIQPLPNQYTAGQEEHTGFSVEPGETELLAAPPPAIVQRAVFTEAPEPDQTLLQRKQEEFEPPIKRTSAENRPSPVEETSQITDAPRAIEKRPDLSESAGKLAYQPGNQAYQADHQTYTEEQNYQAAPDIGYAQKGQSNRNDVLNSTPRDIEDTKEFVRSAPVERIQRQPDNQTVATPPFHVDTGETNESGQQELKGELLQHSLVQKDRNQPPQDDSADAIESGRQEPIDYARQRSLIQRETIDNILDSQPVQKAPDETNLEERGKEKESGLPLHPKILQKSQESVQQAPPKEPPTSRRTKENQQDFIEEIKPSLQLLQKDTVQRQTSEREQQLETRYSEDDLQLQEPPDSRSERIPYPPGDLKHTGSPGQHLEFPAIEPVEFEEVGPDYDRSTNAAPGALISPAPSLDPVHPIKHIQRKVGLADEVYKRDEIRRHLPLSSPDIRGFQDMEQDSDLSMLAGSGTADSENGVETDTSAFQYNPVSQDAAQNLPYRKTSPTIQRAQFPRAEFPLRGDNINVQLRRDNVNVQPGSVASMPGIDHLISTSEPIPPVETVQRLPLASPLKIEPRSVHEMSIQRTVETEDSNQTPAKEAEEPELDLNDLARKVYPHIKRLLAIERERFSGR